jgi:hypothetical protein
MDVEHPNTMTRCTDHALTLYGMGQYRRAGSARRLAEATRRSG